MEYETQKTEAIVLEEKEMGELDKLFILYTKDFGKIEVLGKSIRKIKAKLRGGLQILNYISLEFVQGKNFFIATDAILNGEFLNLKSEPKKFRQAIYICHLLNELVKGKEKDEKIWNLLLETLINLQLTTYNLQLTTRYFEWNLISLLGFKPELHSCINCQEKIKTGKFYFSAKDGGILCERCFKNLEKKSGAPSPSLIEKGENGSLPALREISRDAIKILRLVILQDKKVLLKLKINPIQERELRKISKLYLSYILEDYNLPTAFEAPSKREVGGLESQLWLSP